MDVVFKFSKLWCSGVKITLTLLSNLVITINVTFKRLCFISVIVVSSNISCNPWHKSSGILRLSDKFAVWNKNVSFGPLLSFENVYFWNALQSRVCFVSKHLQLELDSTLSQSWIEFWNWIWNFLFEIQCLTLTWINLSWLFKSTGCTAE